VQAHYNIACLYSVTGKKELALEHLKKSIDRGFMDFSWMDRDKDLDNIRNEPGFRALREMILKSPPADINQFNKSGKK